MMVSREITSIPAWRTSLNEACFDFFSEVWRMPFEEFVLRRHMVQANACSPREIQQLFSQL